MSFLIRSAETLARGVTRGFSTLTTPATAMLAPRPAPRPTAVETATRRVFSEPHRSGESHKPVATRPFRELNLSLANARETIEDASNVLSDWSPSESSLDKLPASPIGMPTVRPACPVKAPTENPRIPAIARSSYPQAPHQSPDSDDTLSTMSSVGLNPLLTANNPYLQHQRRWKWLRVVTDRTGMPSSVLNVGFGSHNYSTLRNMEACALHRLQQSQYHSGFWATRTPNFHATACRNDREGLVNARSAPTLVRKVVAIEEHEHKKGNVVLTTSTTQGITFIYRLQTALFREQAAKLGKELPKQFYALRVAPQTKLNAEQYAAYIEQGFYNEGLHTNEVISATLGALGNFVPEENPLSYYSNRASMAPDEMQKHYRSIFDNVMKHFGFSKEESEEFESEFFCLVEECNTIAHSNLLVFSIPLDKANDYAYLSRPYGEPAPNYKIKDNWHWLPGNASERNGNTLQARVVIGPKAFSGEMLIIDPSNPEHIDKERQAAIDQNKLSENITSFLGTKAETPEETAKLQGLYKKEMAFIENVREAWLKKQKTQ